MDNYLQHHGVLGQRWGVRRYQPYPAGHKGGREIGEAAKLSKGRAKRYANKLNMLDTRIVQNQTTLNDPHQIHFKYSPQARMLAKDKATTERLIERAVSEGYYIGSEKTKRATRGVAENLAYGFAGPLAGVMVLAANKDNRKDGTQYSVFTSKAELDAWERGAIDRAKAENHNASKKINNKLSKSNTSSDDKVTSIQKSKEAHKAYVQDKMSRARNNDQYELAFLEMTGEVDKNLSTKERLDWYEKYLNSKDDMVKFYRDFVGYYG